MSFVIECNYQKESMAMMNLRRRVPGTPLYVTTETSLSQGLRTQETFVGFVTPTSSRKLDFTTLKLSRVCIDAIRVHPSSIFAEGKNLWQIQD